MKILALKRSNAMKNMTVRLKLVVLMLVSVLALVSASGAGWFGIKSTSGNLKVVGAQLMPAVLGLEVMKNARTAAQSAANRAAFLESDPEASDEFIDGWNTLHPRNGVSRTPDVSPTPRTVPLRAIEGPGDVRIRIAVEGVGIKSCRPY
jgi:hypothetical protein